MSRGSAAEAQVVSGDQTTATADDETLNKEELEIAWHVASRKTSKSKFTKIRNRILSFVEDASASCREVEQFFAELKELEAKLEETCEKLRYLFTVPKADAHVTQLDQWLDKLFDEALEVKSAVARYLDNRSSSRNSSVRSSKKSAAVKSKISKSTDKQQSGNLFETMNHEMPEFEIPTMNLDSIAHHRDKANLKATSKRVIHGQQELQDEEKSEKVITNKTAVTGKSKPDNYRDTVDWVESQQNICATTNERSQLNSNSDSVEKEIRQLEEEIKIIRAARQAVSDLQMPIMTNRRTNVSLRDHDMIEQSSQPRREAESNLELWRALRDQRERQTPMRTNQRINTSLTGPAKVKLSRSTPADEGNSNKLSNHLERIHLPTFSGDKTKFEE
jgi:hypothetical protein